MSVVIFPFNFLDPASFTNMVAADIANGKLMDGIAGYIKIYCENIRRCTCFMAKMSLSSPIGHDCMYVMYHTLFEGGHR